MYPRIPFLLACISSTLMVAPGCVPQNRYDAAVAQRNTAETERQRLTAELARVDAALSKAEEAIRNRDQTIAIGQTQLAQEKLVQDRTTTERDDAVALVDQLRGELARVGAHLQEFSDQKRDLELALEEADTRAKRLADTALGPAFLDPSVHDAQNPTISMAGSQPNASNAATDRPPSTRISSPVTNGAEAK